MANIELTHQELIIVQDLVSQEKLKLQINDPGKELKTVRDLNNRLREELNKEIIVNNE